MRFIGTYIHNVIFYLYQHKDSSVYTNIPPHSASCPSVSPVSAGAGGRKTPPVLVAMGETTTGASGVFVPTFEGETPPP